MKNKILLSTLLGGALMAGCTADDTLDVNKVAENVNPAAPVFKVSFVDDDVTRATMYPDDREIVWDSQKDLMSLYHGGQTTGSGLDFFPTGIFAYTRNAVYNGAEKDENGAVDFKTAAMVLPGSAIMVFPADTKMINRTSTNPIISIEVDEQDKTTKDLTPYVSEVLDIVDLTNTTDKGNNLAGYDHTAGYNHTYQISMRRIGGLLNLGLNAKNEKTVNDAVENDPDALIKFKSVTMSVDDNSDSNPFTKEMEIKIGKNRRTGSKNNEVEVLGGDNTGHPYWAYTPWIEPTTGGKSNTIKTTNMGEDGKTAYFTLLPADDRDNMVFSADEKLTLTNSDGKTEYKDVPKPLFNGLKIIVKTNYGSITCVDQKNGKDERIWNAATGWDLTVTEGLAEFLFANFHPQEEWTNRNGDKMKYDKTYKGQLMATYGNRTLTIDMNDLEMNGLHVTDENNLMNALKVYEAVVKNKPVTFILDGAKSGKYKGMFEMTSDTWNKLEKILGTTGNQISLALCAVDKETEDDAPCSAIVLNNVGATNAAEVPSLQFLTEVFSKRLEDKVQSEVNIKLDGNWAYEKVTDLTDATKSGYKKNFEGVNSLVLLTGSDLSLKNNVAVSKGLTKGIIIENGAVVNVTEKKTDVYVTLTNNGTIVISENGELRAAGGTIINNYEKQVTTGTLLTGLTASKYGVIKNSGILGLNMDVADGAVNNYGKIEILTASANTLVSTNALVEQVVSTNYGTNNMYIGTIDIDKATESKVTVNGNKGFIKKTITTDTTTEGIGDLANYIILDDGCTKVTADEGGLPSVGSWTKGVKFIEVKTKNLVTFTGTAQILLEGLIVPTGSRVDIDRGAQVTMHGSRGTIYMTGTIVNGGTIKYGNKTNNELNGNTNLFNGYFGEGLKDITTIN